jgi:TolB-like protein
MSGSDGEKPKIAVLTEEEPRLEPDLDPPEDKDVGKQIKRGGRFTFLIGGLFLLVLVCGLIPTSIYIYMSAPERGGTIAVLPIVMSAEDDSVADTVTADLIKQLGEQELLQVTGKAASMKYKGDERDLTEIGSELAVKYIVQGDLVVRDDKTLTLKLDLINASEGGKIPDGGGRYNGTVDELGKVEAKAIEAILVGTLINEAAAGP